MYTTQKLIHVACMAIMTILASMVLAIPASAADPLKVGFIYVGPTGDHGWTYQHDRGRIAVEQEFGDKVETTYVESVPEGSDALRVISQMVDSGHELIFTTSFGYMNPTLRAAKQFPHVKFEHATGFKRNKNMATYAARFYEGRYVVGHMAGKLTKTNVIGYVASFPIPEVIRGINATLIAARKVNPEVQIKVVWVNSWFDPGKESDAAKALIDQGADIIFQHTDSPAPVQVAEERGVWTVGQASDMSHFGPKKHMTAIIDNWSNYYRDRVEAAIDGSWESQDTWGGISSGMVSMGAYNKSLPEDVVALARQVTIGIADGSIRPFTGPIKKQNGDIAIPAGQYASDTMLLGMNFYVEGVVGSIPK